MDARHGDIDSDIPARLDALHWSRFHTLVALALGITWVLDGLEVTLAGAVSGALKASPALHLDDAQVGLSASPYLAGAVLGAFAFGHAADRLGRRRLFFVTLGLYLCATAASALAPNAWSFMLFRFLTGAGIGGEYTAINSAVQEFVPARYRGRADLVINGSFWLGAALGALGAWRLLQPCLLPPDLGWRLAFGIGAVLGLAVLLLRGLLPESPRWLLTQGRVDEAEAIMRRIEQDIGHDRASDVTGALPRLRLRVRRGEAGLAALAGTLFRRYPRRAWLCLVLMAAQAFFYNAIFFTYALVLERFHHVDAAQVGLYLLPFSMGNFLGPLLLGRAFDTLGRRRMIAGTYAASGLLLLVSTALFLAGVLGAATQTLAWTCVFFFASAAASAAYLTAGESFPLEVRALAIALFYALGTAIGGVLGPWLFARLIARGSAVSLAEGYVLAAGLMLMAAAAAWRFGLDAEGRGLEALAPPLSTRPPRA